MNEYFEAPDKDAPVVVLSEAHGRLSSVPKGALPPRLPSKS
jgi:hypothetical protein